MKTLLIDNYDSFTFNLFQLLAEVIGEEPLVVRNDEFDWMELAGLPIDNIVISPGPGTPQKLEDFGVCSTVLRESRKPVLGVCLGHQGLGSAYGATIAPAPMVMHGRLSRVFHDGSSLFANLPQGFQAVRYHSLIVIPPLPACLETIAWTVDGTIMGLRHRERPLWGVQFHPESVLTKSGPQLITNFLEITRLFGADGARMPSTRRTPQVRAGEANGVLEQSRAMLPKSYEARCAPLTVLCRRLATMYDPERTFTCLLARERYAFWLDSSLVADGLSRFSFMGAVEPRNGLIVRYEANSQRLDILHSGVTSYRSESIFDYLERELRARACESQDLPFDFVGGFVGYFGYELKRECGAPGTSRARTPDSTFLFADRFLAFDHREGVTYLICLTRQDEQAAADAWFAAIEERLRTLPQMPEIPLPREAQRPVVFHLDRSHEEHINNIRLCLRYLMSGDTYEICLTNQLSTAAQMEPLVTYRNLRRLNPAPYSAFLRLGDLAVLSSSPERFLRIDRSRHVEAKPIKGTAARGISPEEDHKQREALRASEKERAENLMIVDLLRNDLGRVCRIGSVYVSKLMEVESYQTVHQLVSTIRGQLRPDLGVIDCIRAAFPGGSMTGAPKLRTMQILDALEAQPRGIYSGALGYLGINGTADLSIVIRTIVMEAGTASIGVGGAIVAQSDPEREFDEILLKGRAPMEAIALTMSGSRDEGAWQINNGRIPAR